MPKAPEDGKPEEEEEDDDIVDAGAIDDPEGMRRASCLYETLKLVGEKLGLRVPAPCPVLLGAGEAMVIQNWCLGLARDRMWVECLAWTRLVLLVGWRAGRGLEVLLCRLLAGPRRWGRVGCQFSTLATGVWGAAGIRLNPQAIFNTCMKAPGEIIWVFGVGHHHYADDSQLCTPLLNTMRVGRAIEVLPGRSSELDVGEEAKMKSRQNEEGVILVQKSKVQVLDHRPGLSREPLLLQEHMCSLDHKVVTVGWTPAVAIPESVRPDHWPNGHRMCSPHRLPSKAIWKLAEQGGLCG